MRYQIHSSLDTRSPILSVSTLKSITSFLLQIAKVGLLPLKNTEFCTPKYSIRHSPCGLMPILPYIKCCVFDITYNSELHCVSTAVADNIHSLP